MDREKLEQFKKILLEKRLDITTAINRISESGENEQLPDAMDSVDRADSSTSADYNISLRENLLRQVREIDDALELIRTGGYGICENCGQDIPEGRLEARPRARFCTQCKSEMEKRGEIK